MAYHPFGRPTRAPWVFAVDLAQREIEAPLRTTHMPTECAATNLVR